MDILKTLQKEIKTCGKTRYRIWKDTGVDQAVLCRIMQGGSCKAETVEKLLVYFDYVISKKKMR